MGHVRAARGLVALPTMRRLGQVALEEEGRRVEEVRGEGGRMPKLRIGRHRRDPVHRCCICQHNVSGRDLAQLDDGRRACRRHPGIRRLEKKKPEDNTVSA